MTIQEARQRLFFQLYHIYDNSEAANIADMVMEKITGWKRIDRIMNRDVKLSQQMETLLENYIRELLDFRPVQYVLQEAWFDGMKFFVNEDVLIPRPETEELVDLVFSSVKTSARNPALTILDIGVGSGCIAIALKKKLPMSRVNGCDISEAALEIAKINALSNGAEINLFHTDIRDSNLCQLIPPADIIVSNPPYIPLNERAGMDKNVIQHEPHLALFVEESDPLLFYRAIAGFTKMKSVPEVSVFVEVHENAAAEVAQLFIAEGFSSTAIKKDMQGKERMVHAVYRG